MNYQETIEWMYKQLPMFQNIGSSAYKKDLTNTLAFLEHLNNPHKNLKCLHIAGTNGKGSTSSMLSSILQEAGYKIGLYTSPHLKDYRERIKINGVEIDQEYVTNFISKHQDFLQKQQLSFFEMTVCMAFQYFYDQKIDYAVIEVGMGGRLDSTNVITPIVAVITNIGWDHTQYLGDTLAKIAFEKAGIIKNNIPTVIGVFTPETKIVFEKISHLNNSKIFFASHNPKSNFNCVLKGKYQEENIKTVLQTIEVLNLYYNLKINNTIIANGLLNVIKNTNLQGRWQQLQNNPTIICDTAHNYDGLKITLQQVQEQNFEQLHFVLGFVNDKDLDQIIPLFPKNAHYYLCKPNIPRGMEVEIAQSKFKELDRDTKIFSSVSQALENAKNHADKNDFIYVGGSTFVVAEVL
ncbi:MAG: bifunctional folylpolyglutamate synthase/dihydrofolate synthase [Flavobacterium sp.]